MNARDERLTPNLHSYTSLEGQTSGEGVVQSNHHAVKRKWSGVTSYLQGVAPKEHVRSHTDETPRKSRRSCLECLVTSRDIHLKSVGHQDFVDIDSCASRFQPNAAQTPPSSKFIKCMINMKRLHSRIGLAIQYSVQLHSQPQKSCPIPRTPALQTAVVYPDPHLQGIKKRPH